MSVPSRAVGGGGGWPLGDDERVGEHAAGFAELDAAVVDDPGVVVGEHTCGDESVDGGFLRERPVAGVAVPLVGRVQESVHLDVLESRDALGFGLPDGGGFDDLGELVALHVVVAVVQVEQRGPGRDADDVGARLGVHAARPISSRSRAACSNFGSLRRRMYSSRLGVMLSRGATDSRPAKVPRSVSTVRRIHWTSAISSSVTSRWSTWSVRRL